MKILQEQDIAPIYIFPGDTFNMLYDGKRLLSQVITKRMTVNKLVVFEVNNEIGLKVGIGGIFGERHDC